MNNYITEDDQKPFELGYLGECWKLGGKCVVAGIKKLEVKCVRASIWKYNNPFWLCAATPPRCPDHFWNTLSSTCLNRPWEWMRTLSLHWMCFKVCFLLFPLHFLITESINLNENQMSIVHCSTDNFSSNKMPRYRIQVLTCPSKTTLVFLDKQKIKTMMWSNYDIIEFSPIFKIVLWIWCPNKRKKDAWLSLR